jgi:hypothetical protein
MKPSKIRLRNGLKLQHASELNLHLWQNYENSGLLDSLTGRVTRYVDIYRLAQRFVLY